MFQFFGSKTLKHCVAMLHLVNPVLSSTSETLSTSTTIIVPFITDLSTNLRCPCVVSPRDKR